MRKTISIFLALIFLTMLSGCGSSNDKTSSNDASSKSVFKNRRVNLAGQVKWG